MTHIGTAYTSSGGVKTHYSELDAVIDDYCNDPCVNNRTTLAATIVQQALCQGKVITAQKGRAMVIFALKCLDVRLSESGKEFIYQKLIFDKLVRKLGQVSAKVFVNTCVNDQVRNNARRLDAALKEGAELLTIAGCFYGEQEALATLESITHSDHEPGLDVDAEFRRLPLPRGCQSLKDAREDT